MFRKHKFIAFVLGGILISSSVYAAGTKLSDIANGGAFVPGTDSIVTVRTGNTDVLTTLGTAAVENLATVIVDDGSDNLTIGSGVVTSTMLGTNSVTTAKINASTVTYAKLQNETASTLLGNSTGSAAAPSEITLGTNLSFSGSVLNATGGGTGANPIASVGLSAVNGSATTFLRSDGAPALSQAIVPTWTGEHTFAAPTGTVKAIFQAGSSETADFWDAKDSGGNIEAYASSYLAPSTRYTGVLGVVSPNSSGTSATISAIPPVSAMGASPDIDYGGTLHLTTGAVETFMLADNSSVGTLIYTAGGARGVTGLILGVNGNAGAHASAILPADNNGATNNATYLGDASFQFSGLYSVAGTFSGTTTASTSVASASGGFQLGTAPNQGPYIYSTATNNLILGAGLNDIAIISSSGFSEFLTTHLSGNTGLIIQGVTSQTGDLQDWRNASSIVVAGVSPSGVLTLGAGSTQTGQAKFNGTTSGTVTLSTQDAAGTWTMKMPTTAGLAGQFWQTDGSGNSTWATAPSVVGNARMTGLTAAQALATYTVGAADASFMVSANVLVTTATLHNFTATVSYTDESNTSRVVTLNFSTLAGALTPTIANAGGAAPYEGVPLHIRCKAGTTIIVATTGTFTTVTYNFEERIQQL